MLQHRLTVGSAASVTLSGSADVGHLNARVARVVTDAPDRPTIYLAGSLSAGQLDADANLRVVVGLSAGPLSEQHHWRF